MTLSQMNLLKIESKKYNLKPYIYSGVIILFVSLAFVYLLACIPKFDPQELASNPELGNYDFLFQFSFIINVAGFVCLGAAMLAKIVLEAYNEKTIYLTFSYPVSRGRVLLTKVLFCSLFSGLGVVVSIFITNHLFFLSEKLFPLVQDDLTYQLLWEQLIPMGVGGLLVISISLLALVIGWQKRSISLTIVMAIIFCSILSNIVTMGNSRVLLVLSLIFCLLTLIAMSVLVKNVKQLEV